MLPALSRSGESGCGQCGGGDGILSVNGSCEGDEAASYSSTRGSTGVHCGPGGGC